MTAISDEAILPGWQIDANACLTLPCPSSMTDAARAFLAKTSPEPATPRLAATVMLLRPGRRRLARGDVEVFMLRRSPRMVFAPDALVFPGGGVHPSDAERPGWHGPSPSEWGRLMGCSPDQAAVVVTAAVRELFEESGVLLAGDHAGRHVAGLNSPEWRRDREALTHHEATLADVLGRRGLVLRSDLLGVRGHWVTPEFEPRRYDTYFFTALVPPGQHAHRTTTEAVGQRWLRPKAILQSAACREITVLPPTAYNIAHLAECSSAEAFAYERRIVDQVMLAPIHRPDDSIALSCRLPDPSGRAAHATVASNKER